MARRVRIPGAAPETERAINELVGSLEERLRKLEARPGRAGVLAEDTVAKPGEFLTFAARSDSMPTCILPAPTQENRNARVTIAFRNSNPVRISCINGTVNGASSVINTSTGTVECICDGDTGWATDGSLSSTGSAVDAHYVVSQAHASLPNARVATDSTEIDADITVANVISWALRAASVVFAKLQNVTGPTILGRNDAGSGAIEELTGAEAGHLIKKAKFITATISANQNDFSPTGFATADHVFVDTGGGDYTITGFDASVFDEIPGTEFVISLTSTGSLTFTNNSGSSLLANRLRVPIVSGSTFRISQNEAVKFRRVNDFWLALPHAPLLTGQLMGNRLQRGNVITATLSGTTHNWAPANLLTADTIEITLTGNATLTGLDSTVFNVGGATASGREIILHNVDATDTLTLPTNSGSLTGNCFHSRAPNRSLNVRPGQAVHVRKEGNFWVARLLEGPLLTNQVLLNDTTGTADPRGLSMGASTILARLASGNIIAATITQILDLIGSTRGSLTYRGAAAWSLLTPGTSGLPVVSQGAGADPIYSRLALAALPQIANAGRVWGLQIDGSAPANAVELTGAEQFENLRLDTTQSTGAVSGTLDITLNADATRLVIQSTGDCTLNTISGYVAGRILLVEHVRSSGSGVLTIAHNAAGSGTSIFGAGSTAVGPLGNRTHVLLVGNSGNWKVVAIGPSRATSAISGLVQASTSLVMSGAEMQRAALTGVVTATQNSNTTAFDSTAAQTLLNLLATPRAGNIIVHNGVSWTVVDELLTEEFWTQDSGSGGSDFGAWFWAQPDGVNMLPNSSADGRVPGHPGVVRQACAPSGVTRAMAETTQDTSGDRGEILGEDIAFFRVVVRVVNPDSVADAFSSANFGVGLVFFDSSGGTGEFNGASPNMGGEGIALLKVGVNSDWLIRVEDGSTGDSDSTGVTAVVSEWIEAVFVQTAAGTWNAYINGTLTNTGKTGGPQGVGLVPAVWCDNDHATETRYWQIDLFQVGLRFTNPRYD